MNYSVKELREKLSEHVLGLGIDASFLKNPALASAISQINNLIGQMNMSASAESVTVTEEDGNISFNWTSNIGEKYTLSISCTNPETFTCIRTEEKKPYLGTNGQYIREKNALEQITTIDTTSGFLTLTTNGSMVDDINCTKGSSNNFTWSERKCYTDNGVMKEREHKSFVRYELPIDFDRIQTDTMLTVPRQAFNGSWKNNFESREILRRDSFDTARFIVEDKTKNIRYSAITPLNIEYGLRDMELQGGDPYPQEVIIPPLSKEEIEAMIQKEINPKVAEGLRQYAIGRDTYSYNSQEDKYFVCEGIDQVKSI